MSDRRSSMREFVYAPINVHTAQRRDRVGMFREMSRTGALFHSRSQFEVGERLTMQYRAEHGELTFVEGTVVRAFRDSCEDNVFQFLTAVQFEDEAELADPN
jgi:hypothetical protein